MIQYPRRKSKALKKTKRARAGSLFLFIVLSFPLFSQEKLSPVYGNDILKASWKKIQTSPLMRMMSPGDTLNLPFTDDFSYADIYPKSALWIDSNVFVNRDFPVAPVTLGVATFDGVSKSGCPYDTVSTNFSALRCDSLTSKPIDLSYQSTDGVYLSFYYQAQGRGEEPEAGDSLLLQFRSPVAGWTTVWGAEGYSLTSGDTSFRRVMLPITDTTWLKTGFQFRFLNLGARQGNVDMWHLDYVYLNDQRSAADTLLKDISFVYSANSFLTKYKAMPWNQYVTTEMAGSVYNLIRNNDSVMKNTTYEYRVYDPAQTQINTTYSGAGNINPFITAGYTNCTVPSPCPNILQPNVSTSPANFNFPSMSGNTTYTIEHRITASPNLITDNDTLRYKQVFSNYYAYDDGTAEHAYGLSVIGAKLAYKFTLNQADTIRAVDMYFNWMPNGLTNPPSNSVTQRAFRITIWNDQNGQPNNVVYQDSVVTPAYHYEEHDDWGNLSNQFYRYALTSPLLLSGTFYVGWVQYTDDLLNIGFDENTNNSSKIFYNTSGNWTNTTFSGSLMIRPVFGTPLEAAAGESEIITNNGVSVFPNPGSGNITFNTPGNDEYSVRLADLSGRILRNGSVRSGQSWDVSDLANGVYLLLFDNSEGKHSAIRLILQK